MAGVLLLSRSTRPCELMHGHARTFSEQVIASIIDDCRGGLSDAAFRTAQPIGGLSCFCFVCIPLCISHHIHICSSIELKICTLVPFV